MSSGKSLKQVLEDGMSSGLVVTGWLVALHLSPTWLRCILIALVAVPLVLWTRGKRDASKEAKRKKVLFY